MPAGHAMHLIDVLTERLEMAGTASGDGVCTWCSKTKDPDACLPASFLFLS